MRYAKIKNGIVDNIILSDAPFNGHTVECTPGVCIGWGYNAEDGVFIEPELAAPAVTEDACTRHVASLLNAQAVALGYDSIESAVSYAEEPTVPEYQAEGLALRAWRSAMWAKCFEVLGAGLPATIEDLTAALPAFPGV